MKVDLILVCTLCENMVKMFVSKASLKEGFTLGTWNLDLTPTRGGRNVVDQITVLFEQFQACIGCLMNSYQKLKVEMA